MAAPRLHLQDIHLTFGGQPLLKGADLIVHEAERLCLIGRNGSGKSTLLKIAAGMVEPDKGTRSCDPKATIRYLPQEPDFSGFSTTLSYVEAGLAPGDDPYRAVYLLTQLGMTGDEDPRHLSGGEARRTALARTLDFRSPDQPSRSPGVPSAWRDQRQKSKRSRWRLIRPCESNSNSASMMLCTMLPVAEKR